MGKFCCCNCIFSCICACVLQILCVILILLGIVGLLIWAIWRPNKIYFHVSDASVNKFDFSKPTNTLDYDINLAFDVRNSNKKMGVIYEVIEAKTRFHTTKINTMNIESFYQPSENTTVLRPVIKGQNEVKFGDRDISSYDEAKKSGNFNINMLFHLTIKFKSGWITTGNIKFAVACILRVPMKSVTSKNFDRTRCYVLPWWRSS